MIAVLNGILAIGFLLCILGIIIGLVSPRTITLLLITKKDYSRKRITLVFLLFAFLIALLGGVLTSPEQQSKATDVTQKQAATPTGKPNIARKPKATLKSTDPCGTPADYTNYQMWQECEDLDKPTPPEINATVRHNDVGVTITNNDTTEWDQCTLTVNKTIPSGDDFQSDGFVLKAGQTTTIPWSDMINAESTRFNYYQTKPYSVDSDCVVGGHTDQKTGVFEGGQHHHSTFTM